jgi:hypothetical protein
MYGCPQRYVTHQENTIFLRPPPAYDCLTPRPAKRPRFEGDTRRRPSAEGYQPGGPTVSEDMMRHVAATNMCRFQTGFAAEGMLCNEPPIPLRVLDFLGTYELVNLSLVCKATHQAGHVLLKREVRGSILKRCNLDMQFFPTSCFSPAFAGCCWQGPCVWRCPAEFSRYVMCFWMTNTEC